MRKITKHFIYYSVAFLLSFLASPALACAGMLAAGTILLTINRFLGILIALFGIGCLWYWVAKKAKAPNTVFKRLLPICVPFVYYMTVWIVSFALNDYQYGYSPTFIVLTLPFAPIVIPFLLWRFYIGFPITVAILYSVIIVAYLAGLAASKWSTPDIVHRNRVRIFNSQADFKPA